MSMSVDYQGRVALIDHSPLLTWELDNILPAVPITVAKALKLLSGIAHPHFSPNINNTIPPSSRPPAILTLSTLLEG